MISVRVNKEKIEYVKCLEYGKDKYLLPSLYNGYGEQSLVFKRHKDIFTPIISFPIFLDTETSHNHDEEYPLTWIYQWCVEFGGLVLGGRRPSELITFLQKVKRHYGLGTEPEETKCIIYIHNASYDISFIIEYLKEAFGDVNILALKAHKILSVECGGFIFKCSYLLSNRSLEAWANFTRSEVHKAEGAIDYDIVRYQDSNLNYFDWYYQVNDVLTMKYSYKNMLAMYGDNTSTIPLTNTGYIRRDLRKASRKDKNNRKAFENARMSPYVYKALLSEFAGGLTHGNRYLAGTTIVDNIGHYDYKSDYPARIELEDMPISGFEPYYNCKVNTYQMTMDKLQQIQKKYCTLIQVAFKDINLKEHVTLPIISRYKAEYGKIGRCRFTVDFNCAEFAGDDNGKVVNCHGTFYLWLTEHDFDIIRRQYDGQMVILKVLIAEKGKLPKFIIDTVLDYFRIKENVEGSERDKAKNNLNASYGICAQKPVRDDIVFDFEEHIWKTISYMHDDEALAEKLDKFYENRNNFMWFSWGCYITSTARALLVKQVEGLSSEKHINGVSKGYDLFYYCDTDSIFFKHTEEAVASIEQFNKNIIARCEAEGKFVINKKGTKSYFGTFEDEGEGIKQFRFLHSKCYAFVDKDDKLHCTIAGVPKRTRIPSKVKGLFEKDKLVYMTNAEELGSIDNLEDHFVFKVNGGTTAAYIYSDIRSEYVNGHIIEHAGGCIIKRCEKTLNELEYIKPYTEYDYDDIDVEVIKGVNI